MAPVGPGKFLYEVLSYKYCTTQKVTCQHLFLGSAASCRFFTRSSAALAVYGWSLSVKAPPSVTTSATTVTGIDTTDTAALVREVKMSNMVLKYKLRFQFQNNTWGQGLR